MPMFTLLIEAIRLLLGAILTVGPVVAAGWLYAQADGHLHTPETYAYTTNWSHSE